MPSMPLQGAAMHSRGLFMGGGGHQLAVQLTWLMFVICWSLLFTLPVCVVLMMLGAHPCTGATVFRRRMSAFIGFMDGCCGGVSEVSGLARCAWGTLLRYSRGRLLCDGCSA